MEKSEYIKVSFNKWLKLLLNGWINHNGLPCGCMGAGGPRGATPHSRSGGAAVRRYPLSKVRSRAALCWSSHEEIPQVQGKRNPSKTVGVARGIRGQTHKP